MIDVGKTQATVSGATTGLVLLEETGLSKQSAGSPCGHCSTSCFVFLPWLPSTMDYRLLRYDESFHPQVDFLKSVLSRPFFKKKKVFCQALLRQYDIVFLPLLIYFLSIFMCMLCLYVCLHVCVCICVYEHVKSLDQIHTRMWDWDRRDVPYSFICFCIMIIYSI